MAFASYVSEHPGGGRGVALVYVVVGDDDEDARRLVGELRGVLAESGQYDITGAAKAAGERANAAWVAVPLPGSPSVAKEVTAAVEACLTTADA